MKISSVEFGVFRNLFLAIAEEMGVTLRRTGFSPNIKERLDYSCAIYDVGGQTIAQGDAETCEASRLATDRSGLLL